MEIVILPVAEEQLAYWKKTGNKIVLKRISILVRAITEDPFHGIGKPEPLKHQLSGKWSRRIDLENRLVYTISNKILYIYSVKGHY
jgi:toxin YoeB